MHRSGAKDSSVDTTRHSLRNAGYRFPRIPEPVEKVAAGPIDGPESDQKCPKSVFWCPIWVSSGARQEFFNTLSPSTRLGE